MAVPLTFDQATNLELPALVCDANGWIFDLNFWVRPPIDGPKRLVLAY